MNIQAITQQMIVLFILLIVGFFAAKKGYMEPVFNKRLSALVINISTPALILSSVMGGERILGNTDIFILLGISIATYVAVILLSMLVPKLLRCQPSDASLMRFMTIFSNTGFMGFPVVAALFGQSAVFYASIFGLPFNFLVYSYGIKLVSGGKTGGFDRKTLTSPCVVCSVLAIILYLLNIPFPELITLPLGYLADLTVPAAMLLIGASLAVVPLRSIFTEWRLYALSVIKLFLLPVLVYLVLRLLPIHEMMLKVTVVMWALPVATNATLLATQYGGDEAMASKGVLLTTLLSMATIPILMMLLFT